MYLLSSIQHQPLSREESVYDAEGVPFINVQLKLKKENHMRNELVIWNRSEVHSSVVNKISFTKPHTKIWTKNKFYLHPPASPPLNAPTISLKNGGPVELSGSQ